MVTLPALTLWQPWASLVAIGAKPYEFRRWAAPRGMWGKRIAIHAGARPIRRTEIDDLIGSLRLEGGWGTALHAEPALELLLKVQADPTCIALSAVLCTAVLGQPRPANEIELDKLASNGFVGDSTRIDHQMWGWPLSDLRLLMPPQPARGAQGFWTVHLEEVAA